MKISEIKKEALQSLKGRWGKAIAITIVYNLILAGINMFTNMIPVASIAIMVITVPLSFGFIGQMIKFVRNEEVGICDYFKIGFENFGKSWSILGNTLLKLLAALITFVVAIVIMGVVVGVLVANDEYGMLAIAIVVLVLLFSVIYVWLFSKALLYTFSEYIGNDNIEMTGKEVVEESARVMKGNRWKYIGFELSFIGWIILACFTLGIGFIWLTPYMTVASVKFYENLVKEKSKSIE